LNRTSSSRTHLSFDRLGIELSELAPEIRTILKQQIDENSLLSAALSDMRGRVEELERLVDADTLTPLPNRRCFVRELNRAVQHARRYGTAACLLFVDVDGLKQINDRHGHLAGDAVLIHIASILASMLRATDVIARIGGDEFGLILESLDSQAAADKAARLREAVADHPIEIGGRPVTLSISVGIAELLAEDDADSFYARADQAMYEQRHQLRSER
jgi:diguanylate cyclase (GGDEF)-like protein